MAITPAVAVVLSAAIAGVGAVASAALAPKPPKPTPPPDPALARDAELKKLSQADDVRARAITEQRQYDAQFIRETGLRL